MIFVQEVKKKVDDNAAVTMIDPACADCPYVKTCNHKKLAHALIQIQKAIEESYKSTLYRGFITGG